MLFWPKGRSLEIEMDGLIIPQVHQTRFLGAILDDDLCWTPHLNHMHEKLCANKHLMQLGRNFLNFDSLLSVYYAHIYSHLTYSLLTWGSMLSQSNADDLFKLQKACVCIVHKKFSRAD